jgi:hypothetical protein
LANSVAGCWRTRTIRLAIVALLKLTFCSSSVEVTARAGWKFRCEPGTNEAPRTFPLAMMTDDVHAPLR